jgi:hypothetical protein
MSDSLAQEGHSINPAACKGLLDKLNALEPQIRGMFHVYIKDKINKTRILKTPAPFGRERQFLGLRPNDNNYKVFNEAFAFIPQSTVGDNTGCAVAFLEDIPCVSKRIIVQEGHDSIIQDVLEYPDAIWNSLQLTIQSFVRPIRFDNGITIDIPVEAELGYNMADTVKIKEPLSYENVVAALEKCNEMRQQDLDEKAQRQAHIDIQNLVASV